MMYKNSALISYLFSLLCIHASMSSAATIEVNTTSMTIDVAGRQFITQDSSGRSGLYQADTLTIADLSSADNLDGLISLPEAIIAANNTAGADTIILQVDSVYEITTPNNYWYGPNALPPITSQITILGNGNQEANPGTLGAIIRPTAGAATKMRLFFIMGNYHNTPTINKVPVKQGSLTLSNLTLENGHALGGSGSGGGAGLGGAIFNQGALSIASVTLSGNTAEGGAGKTDNGIGGGGLSGDGILSLGGGFFEQGFIGTEANLSDATFTSIFGGDGGTNGSGGFRASDNGAINRDDNNDNLPDCSDPRHIPATLPACGLNGGGRAASNSTQSHNGAFGAGGGRPALGNNEDGNAGALGSGGGAGSSIGSSNGGLGGFGGGGGKGATTGGAAGFAGGDGTTDQGGGGAGLGGAIFNHGGNINIFNSTLSGNTSKGGAGGLAHGGSAYGAAIFNLNGSQVSIKLSTLFNNTSTKGTGTAGDGLESSEALYTLGGSGDGLNDLIVSPSVEVNNSILANATDTPSQITADLIGDQVIGSRLIFTGKNLVRGAIASSITVLGAAEITKTDTDIVSGDPELAVLQQTSPNDLTKTHLPNTGSPALDAGDNTTASTSLIFIDQRGIARTKPKDSLTGTLATVDLGSVEAGPNRAPVINIPEEYTIQDSAPFFFNTTTNALTIDDPDIPINSQLTPIFSNGQIIGLIPTPSNFKLTVTFSVTGGSLNFLSKEGLNFGGGPESGSDIEITGTLSAITTALAGLSFTPDENLGKNPGDEGSITVTVNDNGNTGTPANAEETTTTDTADPPQPAAIVIKVEKQPPSPTIIGAPAATNNNAFQIGVYFNEAVNDFSADDIILTNAALSSDLVPAAINPAGRVFVENQLFIATVTPTGGDISIEVPANVATDNIDEPNTAAQKVSIQYDSSRPSINLSGVPNRAGRNAFTVTVNFSEEVSGFTVEDININNASLSDFTSINAKTYNVLVSPSGNNGIEIGIKENVASDALGNGNTELSQQLIPLQRESSSSSYNPLFILTIFMLTFIRRKSQYCV